MHKPTPPRDVFKERLAQRRPELEQAIRQLAIAFGNSDLNEEAIRLFFEDVMDNSWDAFEEATSDQSGRCKKLRAQILDLEQYITHLLGNSHRSLMEQYVALVNNRDCYELEQAFLVGYQCSIRFLLLGILPASSLLQGYRAREAAGIPSVDPAYSPEQPSNS